jgi:WD40 repeat protein
MSDIDVNLWFGFTLEDCPSPPRDLDPMVTAVTPEGRWVVSGSRDECVRIWDTDSRRETAVLRAHRYGVNRVAVTPDAREVISSDAEGKTVRWDTNTGAA